MIRLLILISFALAACSQVYAQAFVYETTTTKATLLLSSTSSKTVAFNSSGMGASVYCSSASTATLSRDGSAPTTTEGAAVALNGSDTIPANSIRVFTASNVGSGTTLKTYTIPAGEEILIDLSHFGLTAGKSVTIATDNSCRMFFIGRVQ